MVGDGRGGKGYSEKGLRFWKDETAGNCSFGNATSAVSVLWLVVQNDRYLEA